MKSTVEIMIEACERLGFEYRLDYSGRSMFGKQCFAIDDCDLMDLVGEITTILQEHYSEEFQNACVVDFAQELSEIFSEISDYCKDSMGRGRIHYWKKLGNSPRIIGF